MTSLPTVIGTTENALRALLLKTLAGALICQYDEWVALNYVSAASPGAPRLVEGLADMLKEDASRVRVLLQHLADQGLLDADHSRYAISQLGRTILQDGRRRVQSATARLTDGLETEDIAVTMRTLERLRTNVERTLH